MTVEFTAFKTPQECYRDKRVGDFMLAFERAPRRAPFFGNILIDAIWTTSTMHDEFPATLQNATIILDGHDCSYADSAMLVFKEETAGQVKTAMAELMRTWEEGKSVVLGYGVEEDTALAYRDMGAEGFFVFIYCGCMEPDRIQEVFASVGVPAEMYEIVETEEKRSGNDFLSSMRDNHPQWFNTLKTIKLIDDRCVILGENEDDNE